MHHNYRSCLRSGCCCCGTVFGVRAYNDYTLQQQTEERIKSIDDTYADFLDETDRSKKLEKLEPSLESVGQILCALPGKPMFKPPQRSMIIEIRLLILRKP